MTVIKPNLTLVDRRGMEWRTAPGFQDREPNRPGWLLLLAANGEELGYAEVLNIYGFPKRNGGKFLRGRYDDEPKHRPWLTDDGTREFVNGKPIGYCSNCVERCEEQHPPCYEEVIGCTEDFRCDDVDDAPPNAGSAS